MLKAGPGRGSVLAADVLPSLEAVEMAVFFAMVAWNESVGLAAAREGYPRAREKIVADRPELWHEPKSNDVNSMIDQLVR